MPAAGHPWVPRARCEVGVAVAQGWGHGATGASRVLASLPAQLQPPAEVGSGSRRSSPPRSRDRCRCLAPRASVRSQVLLSSSSCLFFSLGLRKMLRFAFCFPIPGEGSLSLPAPRLTQPGFSFFFFFFLDEAFSVTKTFSLLPLDIPFSLLNTSVLNYFSSFPSPSSLQLLYYLSSVALEGFIH